MSECKHHYKICGRCQNPLVCNVCGKNHGQIYRKAHSRAGNNNWLRCGMLLIG